MVVSSKRKKGLHFSRRKKCTYLKKKCCYQNENSPFPKRQKLSNSKNSTPFKSKTSTPYKTRTSTVRIRTSTPQRPESDDYFTENAVTDIKCTENARNPRKNLFETDDQHVDSLLHDLSELDISEDLDELSVNISNLNLASVKDTDSDIAFQELVDCLPKVMEMIQKAGKGRVLEKFCHLVKDGKFPLNNIAFSMWCDVVEWFSSEDTRLMRYSPEAVQFFWVGKKLFGGRFIRFMSGMKNETEKLKGSNFYSPQESRINFACPDEKLLSDYNPFDGVLPSTYKPGFLEPMIQYKSDVDKRESPECTKSYVLMFDGKKVKRGGDVDLLGFETDKTLNERKRERDEGLALLDKTVKTISEVQTYTDTIDQTPEQLKKEVYTCLVGLLLLLSNRIKSLRLLKLKRSQYLEKLKEKCGAENDWRKSKFAYAIDMSRTYLWKTENTIEKALKVQKGICCSGSHLNGTAELFARSDSINLLQQANVQVLKDPEQMPSSALENEDTSLIKQRTTLWHNERQKMKVTGSSIYQAIGCDSLKRQRVHFDKVISKITPPEPSEIQQTMMQHGTDCEVHQIATMSSIIMPFLFPDQVFFEEGFYVEDNVLVSPDGSVRTSEKSVTSYAFEGKAPYGSKYATSVHYTVPERYIPQTLFEQRSMKAKSGTLYLSWSEDSCTLFKVLPNEEMCQSILEEIQDVYLNTIPKRPSRISKTAKQIKSGLKVISNECIFLGEFPSVKGYIPDNILIADSEESPYYKHEAKRSSVPPLTYDELRRYFLLGKEVLEDTYDLQRNMASQVVVYLLADLDRFWKEEQPHAIPVAYFFRGYSLSMDIMRNITEECKKRCRSRGLDIIVSAADGEFTNLIVRGKSGAPLTQLQLSKDVWKDACKLTKASIISLFKKETSSYVCTMEIVHNPENIYDDRVVRVVRSKNKSLTRINTSKRGWKPAKKIQNVRSDAGYNDVAVIENDDEINAEQVNECVVESSEQNIENQPPVDGESPTIAERDGNDIGMDAVDEDNLDDTVIYTIENMEMLVSDLERDDSRSKLLPQWIPDIRRVLVSLNEKKWSDKTEHALTEYFHSAETLNKFTVKELIEITKYINLQQTDQKKRLTFSGLNKSAIVNQLSKRMSDGSEIRKANRQRKPSNAKSLKTLAQNALMKKTYPKKALNIAYAEFVWPDRKKEWLSNAHVSETVFVSGVESILSPYYVPDFNEKTQDFEIGVYDKTHLGSNLRKALALDRVAGISKNAWIRVSESNPEVLNPTLLEVTEDGKIVDQMKEKLARNMFTKEVEEIMLANGDGDESRFCHIIREGLYVAEDVPGIPAVQRCQKRMNLIEWLQEGVDFGRFPPYGSKIKGMSYILYEGLRSSNEAKLFLYALAKSGTYCVRAPNTLCSESFFSTMQEMDPWGQGVLTTAGVEKHISDFTTVTALKMKEDRPFHIRTKKDAAYPVHDVPSAPDLTDDATLHVVCECRKLHFIKCIIPRDHFFDTSARARRSHPVDKPFKFSDLNLPARGDLPIRAQYGYRMNEATILPSKRLGLKIDHVQ